MCGRAYGGLCEANDAMPHTKLQRGENDVCVSHLRHAIGELHLHSVGSFGSSVLHEPRSHILSDLPPEPHHRFLAHHRPQ